MNNIAIKESIIIENLIYEVRGKQVMLDSDLARLYECNQGTKEINQAVRNNPTKFPERFSWILTEEEWKFLRSNNLTLENNTPGKGHYPQILT